MWNKDDSLSGGNSTCLPYAETPLRCVGHTPRHCEYTKNTHTKQCDSSECFRNLCASLYQRYKGCKETHEKWVSLMLKQSGNLNVVVGTEIPQLVRYLSCYYPQGEAEVHQSAHSRQFRADWSCRSGQVDELWGRSHPTEVSQPFPGFLR